eukprot:TRINITY_DN92016_c0_g1_i1.p1 TRINITY_DN92016_c0_g1~~TRINITY_DN92016_c0_g1_i1.p1  ORF type:complete len:1327 (+),score=262.28 TRINITY_DN92016_c0_g1_i1:133-4113(+)
MSAAAADAPMPGSPPSPRDGPPDGTPKSPRSPAEVAPAGAGEDEPEAKADDDLGPPPLPPPAEDPPPDRPSFVERMKACFERFQEIDIHLPETPQWLKRLQEVPIYADPWGTLSKSPHNYCEALGRYPGPWIFAYVLVSICFIVPLFRPINVNTDLGAFNEVESMTSVNHSVYREALSHMRAVRNDTSLGDRTTYQLEIFYQAKDVEEKDDDGEVVSTSTGSVFSEAALRDIKQFEHDLRKLPGWKKMCDMSDERARFRCEPGESLGNYVWPTRMEDDLDRRGFFKLMFSGVAREQLPLMATLTYLAEGTALPHDPWKFLPQTFSGPRSSSRLMRSLFTFTAPKLNDEDFETAYKEFVSDSLYPVLSEAVERAKVVPDPDTWDEPMHVTISFRGDIVDQHEVRSILANDMLYALASLILMWLILWAQLRSLFLACAGVVILTLAVFLGYGIVHLEEVSLVSFLSVFLTLGLGSNILIVIDNLYHRARRQHPQKLDVTDRLMACYKEAIWWLMPVGFTSVAFFVHLISTMRPMREFGLFSGTSMILVCVLCLLIYVPLLLIHEEQVRPFIYQKLPKRIAVILEPAKLQPPWKRMTASFMKAANKAKNVVIATAVVAGICLIAGVATAATRESAGLPQVFPPSHHRNAGRESAAAFALTAPAEVAAPLNVTFCEPGRTPSGVSMCSLHWCESPLPPTTTTTTGNGTTTATPEVVDDGMRTCRCHRKATNALRTDGRCATLDVEATASGPGLAGVGDAELSKAFKEYVLAEWPNTLGAETLSESKSRQLTSLVLEHWESGVTHIEPLVQLPALRLTQQAFPDLVTIPQHCVDYAVCFCGERTCQAPVGYTGSAATMTMNTSVASSRRLLEDLSPVRRLAGSSASSSSTTVEVVVVYGLQPPAIKWSLVEKKNAWSFDDRFNAASPWAQRAMLWMCEGEDGEGGLPASLKIIESNCWIMDFRDWLVGRGEKWPVGPFLDFNEQLSRFATTHEAAASQMWLNEESQLRATSLHFKVSLSRHSWEVLADQQEWLAYVAMRNEKAFTTAHSAWPTSQAWVDAEAYQEAISGAWHVALLAFGAIVISGLLYTLDMMVVGCVLAVSLVVCIGLGFAMFCIFMWAVGPWEIIILVVFLSYSVEPAFRLGRDFVFVPFTDEDRKKGDEDIAPGVEASDAVENVGAGDAAAAAAAEGEEPDGALVPAEQPREDDQGALVVANPNSNDMEISSAGTPSSAGDTEKGTREATIKRSVYLVSGNVLAGGAKLILTGALLLPCQFRIFSRLGAVAVVVPLVAAPCTLIVLPAVMMQFYPRRDEPDCVTCNRFLISKASWLWT